jgi:hypothetical protein
MQYSHPKLDSLSSKTLIPTLGFLFLLFWFQSGCPSPNFPKGEYWARDGVKFTCKVHGAM